MSEPIAVGDRRVRPTMRVLAGPQTLPRNGEAGIVLWISQLWDRPAGGQQLARSRREDRTTHISLC